MNDNTPARIQGLNIEIDSAKSGDLGLTIPIRDLCRLCEIEFVGQSVRIQGDTIEIEPPRVGYSGISVPISKVREFYKQ